MRSGESIRIFPADWEIRDGDIVLLGSSTIRARVLKCLDGGTEWAHCGLVVAPDSIVHADPKCGVIRQTMNEYLAENEVDCICLLRPKTGNGEIAARFALDCVEKCVEFDNSFRYKNGGGMYCTELVLLAWESAGVEILPNVASGDRIKPSCLAKTAQLYRIRELHLP